MVTFLDKSNNLESEYLRNKDTMLKSSGIKEEIGFC